LAAQPIDQIQPPEPEVSPEELDELARQVEATVFGTNIPSKSSDASTGTAISTPSGMTSETKNGGVSPQAGTSQINPFISQSASSTDPIVSPPLPTTATTPPTGNVSTINPFASLAQSTSVAAQPLRLARSQVQLIKLSQFCQQPSRFLIKKLTLQF
jgi:hypothetical protein